MSQEDAMAWGVCALVLMVLGWATFEVSCRRKTPL